MVQKVLTAPDARILGDYHFREVGKNRKENENLLCLYRGDDGSLAIGQVDRKLVTAWEVFKSYFGFGKLAGRNLSLRAIGRYLVERDLKDLQTEAGYEDALKTVRAIATRLFNKGNTTLQDKLPKDTNPVVQLATPSEVLVNERTHLLAERPSVD